MGMNPLLSTVLLCTSRFTILLQLTIFLHKFVSRNEVIVDPCPIIHTAFYNIVCASNIFIINLLIGMGTLFLQYCCNWQYSCYKFVNRNAIIVTSKFYYPYQGLQYCCNWQYFCHDFVNRNGAIVIPCPIMHIAAYNIVAIGNIFA